MEFNISFAPSNSLLRNLGLSEWVSNDGRGSGRLEAVFSILQQQAVSRSARLSDTEGGSWVYRIERGLPSYPQSASRPSLIKTMAFNLF